MDTLNELIRTSVTEGVGTVARGAHQHWIKSLGTGTHHQFTGHRAG